MNRAATTSERGRAAEAAALAWLCRRGLRPVCSNYRTAAGEIDLIVRDGETLVFVEVRSRTHREFMHPLETIDERKRMRIIRASEQYLQQYPPAEHTPCRFDVITLSGPAGAHEIEWIRDAFEA